MGSFSGVANDLADAIAYELTTLEYLRGSLFKQDETQGGAASITLGDTTEDGIQRVTVFAHVISSISEGAVRAALDRLRPLAFSAAFKIQDMIAEWILRANGVNDWPFSKKLSAYDKLRSGGQLIEPSLFAKRQLLAQSFWELYRFFVPFRGTVVHSGGVALHQDGTIKITRGGDTLLLTTADQGSYMRAVCIISKYFLGQINLDPFLDALIEADLLQLERYHRQKGFTIASVRRAALAVDVPAFRIANQHPFVLEIDFDHLRRTMERVHPVESGGRLYFSVTITAYGDTRIGCWDLPLESVPSGTVILREGDGTFDRFLQVREKT